MNKTIDFIDIEYRLAVFRYHYNSLYDAIMKEPRPVDNGKYKSLGRILKKHIIHPRLNKEIYIDMEGQIQEIIYQLERISHLSYRKITDSLVVLLVNDVRKVYQVLGKRFVEMIHFFEFEYKMKFDFTKYKSRRIKHNGF